MARPKKDLSKGKRTDGRYEYKGVVGKKMDGKAIRKSFYSIVSLADAKSKFEEYLIEQKAAELTGRIFCNDKSGFSQWAEFWLKVYKQPNVDANTYRLTYENSVYKHLNPYFKDADLKSIQPADIQAFFTSKQNLSPSTLSKLKMCLMGIFESAIENDKCYKNPVRSKNISCSSTYKKAEKRVYTAEQIPVVSLLCNTPEITAILYTGMRRGEVCGLMWSDIDMQKRIFTINRSIAIQAGGGVKINPPKWKSCRTNPIEKEFFNLLQELSKNKKSLYVFPNDNGTIQNPNTLSQKIERKMKYLQGIPHLTAHELRHTYGTNLRRRGVDIYSIQKIMGHKDIKMTTELYVHNEVEELQKAINEADGQQTKQAVLLKG